MGLFLHQTTTHLWPALMPWRLFMGLFLHQTTTKQGDDVLRLRCLWVFSYIKPQRVAGRDGHGCGCLWVFSYIKPQRRWATFRTRAVVYGSFPTSNHNYIRVFHNKRQVVYGSFPTSNHNLHAAVQCTYQLFMGLFLHQTTTHRSIWRSLICCLWVFSYIKPQLTT